MFPSSLLSFVHVPIFTLLTLRPFSFLAPLPNALQEWPAGFRSMTSLIYSLLGLVRSPAPVQCKKSGSGNLTTTHPNVIFRENLKPSKTRQKNYFSNLSQKTFPRTAVLSPPQSFSYCFGSVIFKSKQTSYIVIISVLN